MKKVLPLILVLLLISCEKENAIYDIRDGLVGSYFCQHYYSYWQIFTESYGGKTYDTLIVTKAEYGSLRILGDGIYLDSALSYYFDRGSCSQGWVTFYPENDSIRFYRSYGSEGQGNSHWYIGKKIIQ